MRAAILGVLVLAAACSDPAAAVQLASADPGYGPLVGGTRITLAGHGFAGGSNRVLVAGHEAPLAAARGDTLLDVVIPPGDQAGDAELVVLNDLGNARATGLFHYSTPPSVTAVTPPELVFSAAATLTATGTGFLDEGAGDVTVTVGGQLATDVVVTSDSTLTFTAPVGIPLARPDVRVVDTRGTGLLGRAIHYTPSTRGGLLLFSTFGADFAEFFDPVDSSVVAIPFADFQGVRFTAVVLDESGEYWGFDRNRQLGRLDTTTQRLAAPIQTFGWFPTVVRVGGDNFAIERGSLRFGKVDLFTGTFTQIGSDPIPCCGSYGLASDGTTLYFTARQGATVVVGTIDPVTGTIGTPIPVIGAPGLHVEDMRFFGGTLYAASRDSTLVTIDPATGIATVVASLGRFSAMEVFPGAR